MAEAYIIDAVRTPRGIGKPGKGALSHLHPQHLAATVLKAIKERNNLDTATVDDIVWSTSTQKGKQGGDLGRMAALSAGYDIKASGTTLDRFCGGGISSVNFAAASVMSGMEDCVIAGGTEMMSYTAQIGAEEANAGLKPLGMGSGHEALNELHPQSHQGICGDAIATMEGISREALDALAPTRRSRKAASRSRSSPCSTPTAASRSIVRNSRAPKPRPRVSPR
jgi:acetyl-CoA C-acetyltransferase